MHSPIIIGNEEMALTTDVGRGGGDGVDSATKRYGHIRRPSYGNSKTMPISSLLLNLSPMSPLSAGGNHCRRHNLDSISRDGLSPDHECSTKSFHINNIDHCNLNEHFNNSDIDINDDDHDHDELDDSSINADNEFVFVSQPTTPPSLTSSTSSSLSSPTSTPSIQDIEDLTINPKSTISPFDENITNNNQSKVCNKKCDKNCNTPSLSINNSKNHERATFLSTMITNSNDNDDDHDHDQDYDNDNDTNTKSSSIQIQSTNNNKSNNNNMIGFMNKQEFREKLAIAEALARTSMMTSPAARRRIAARKIEMNLNNNTNNNHLNSHSSSSSAVNSTGATINSNNNNHVSTIGILDEDMDYVPPKQLLIYLVRMGSFNSAPKINNADTQDDCFDIPNGLSSKDLIQHCRTMRGESRPELLRRSFLKPTTSTTTICDLISNDLTDGLRVLKLNAVSKVCSRPISSPNNIRLFQWNVLSQSLGQNNDGFVCCPDEALTWECRKYLIIQEIIQNDPDIVCLQEVDHFKFLQHVLGTQDYDGIFFPKPDSPCLYISQNNGPDGCAIFYKKNKFKLVNYDTRILEVWRVQSNQVAIAANLQVLESGKEFCVCTTHLKARNGSLLSKLRNEQGKDLLRFANQVAGNNPLLICGDFNAEPTEPVYTTMLNNPSSTLSSAYADMIASKNMACSEAASTVAATSHSNSANEKENNGFTVNGSSSSSSSSGSGSSDGNGGMDATDCSNNCDLEPNSTISRIDVLASQEPPFTTWKIREDGEVCHTIDYVFYSQEKFKVNNCLMFPKGNEIGKDRTPSFQYPSDHFSLVCDFEFKENCE